MLLRMLDATVEHFCPVCLSCVAAAPPCRGLKPLAAGLCRAQCGTAHQRAGSMPSLEYDPV
jgi:hypothetical protein